MSYFFLENPYLLIPCCAVAAYVLLVLHLRRRTARSRRALLIGSAICIALPILQWAVVTPRERITLVCRALVRAVEQRDAAGIEAHVARNFAVRDIDRAAFIDAVRRTLPAYSIEDARAKLDEIHVNGDTAEVRLRVTGRITGDEEFDLGPGMPWTLRFVREGGEWKMNGADPRATPLFPFQRLEELLK